MRISGLDPPVMLAGEKVDYKKGADASCERILMYNKATTSGTATVGNAKTEKGDIGQTSPGFIGAYSTVYNLAYNSDYYLKKTTDKDGNDVNQCYDMSQKNLVGQSYTLFLSGCTQV